MGDLLLALDNLGVRYALDGSPPVDSVLLAFVAEPSNIAADSRSNGFFAFSDLDSLSVPYTAGTYDTHTGADDLILALASLQGQITGADCP